MLNVKHLNLPLNMNFKKGWKPLIEKGGKKKVKLNKLIDYNLTVPCLAASSLRASDFTVKPAVEPTTVF